jgi:hypothetical protein
MLETCVYARAVGDDDAPRAGAAREDKDGAAEAAMKWTMKPWRKSPHTAAKAHRGAPTRKKRTGTHASLQNTRERRELSCKKDGCRFTG